MVHYPLVSREADQQPDPPRIDGSIHHEQTCHACGVSSRSEHLHPVVRSDGRGGAETLFFCADLFDCTVRKNAGVMIPVVRTS